MGQPSHWDLMLEEGDVLRTWSLASLPAMWKAQLSNSAISGDSSGGPSQVEAARLADHRLAYLDYEGPISAERGEVRREDGGDYRPLESATGLLHVELNGAAIRGPIRLEQVAGDHWRLFAGDAAAW